MSDIRAFFKPTSKTTSRNVTPDLKQVQASKPVTEKKEEQKSKVLSKKASPGRKSPVKKVPEEKTV